jgi:hypothetical protein
MEESSFVDPHWFKKVPDPAFYLNVVRNPGSQTNADPDPDLVRYV